MTLILHILAHALTASLTIVVVLALGLNVPSPRIVEIDSEAVMRAFEAATSGWSDADIAKAAPVFLDAVQRGLETYAAREGAVVVETSLALAGARDVTRDAFEIAFEAITARPTWEAQQ